VPSTTFTRGVLVALALVAGTAGAQEFPPGCYERVYTADHLARHPEQKVSALRFFIGDWMTEHARFGRLAVIPVGQRARAGAPWPSALIQSLICGNEAGEERCEATCDAGALEVTRWDGGGLTFRTRYLMVGGDVAGCGGLLDMAERPGTWVSYRVYRVGDATCAGM
jgi:hypothetical protein